MMSDPVVGLPIKFYATQLRPNDVLLGRGTGPNVHAGNCIFREEIESQKDNYFSTMDQTMKTEIVKDIIRKVHSRGGRFMKRLTSTSRNAGHAYEVVADIKVLTYKVKQGFRYLNDKNGPSSSTVSQRDGKSSTSVNPTGPTIDKSSQGPFVKQADSVQMPSIKEQLPLLATNRLRTTDLFERAESNLFYNERQSPILSDQSSQGLLDLLTRRLPTTNSEDQQYFLAEVASSALQASSQLPVRSAGSLYGIGRSEAERIQVSDLLRRRLELRQCELARQLFKAPNQGPTVGGPSGHKHRTLASWTWDATAASPVTSSLLPLALFKPQQQEANAANAMRPLSPDWISRHVLWPSSMSSSLIHPQQNLQRLLHYCDRNYW